MKVDTLRSHGGSKAGEGKGKAKKGGERKRNNGEKGRFLAGLTTRWFFFFFYRPETEGGDL